jgi:hypothetical protein
MLKGVTLRKTELFSICKKEKDFYNTADPLNGKELIILVIP